LLVYCECIETFNKQFEKFIRSAVSGYSDRSTRDMRISAGVRLSTTDVRIEALEKAIRKEALEVARNRVPNSHVARRHTSNCCSAGRSDRNWSAEDQAIRIFFARGQ
jgi:hypothetical protein